MIYYTILWGGHTAESFMGKLPAGANVLQREIFQSVEGTQFP